MSANVSAKTAIDTRDPINASALFRPVGDSPRSPVFRQECGKSCVLPLCDATLRDYEAADDALVTIHTTIDGRNTWTIFEPGSNEYTSDAGVQMRGAQQGWSAMSGTLTDQIGSYDTPRLIHG